MQSYYFADNGPLNPEQAGLSLKYEATTRRGHSRRGQQQQQYCRLERVASIASLLFKRPCHRVTPGHGQQKHSQLVAESKMSRWPLRGGSLEASGLTGLRLHTYSCSLPSSARPALGAGSPPLLCIGSLYVAGTSTQTVLYAIQNSNIQPQEVLLPSISYHLWRD